MSATQNSGSQSARMRRSVYFQIFAVAGEPHTFQSSGQTYASPQEAEQAGLNAVAIMNALEEKKSTGGPHSDEVCLIPAGHTHPKFFDVTGADTIIAQNGRRGGPLLASAQVGVRCRHRCPLEGRATFRQSRATILSRSSARRLSPITWPAGGIGGKCE